MIWDTVGLNKTVLSTYGYKPLTTPSIRWKELANGNWRGSDRGVAQDVFMSDVNFRGPLAELTDLENILNGNRDDFKITAGVGEEIFGADVDYSSAIDITVVKYGDIRRVSFASFEMSMRLRIINVPVTFLSVSASLGDLRTSAFNWTQNSEYSITRHFTYDNFPTYLDHKTDPGIFQAQFTQTQSEMEKIRRHLLTTSRTASISFPSIGGVVNPFGVREGTGPFNVRVIRWRDLGRPNHIDWNLDITFAREF